MEIGYDIYVDLQGSDVNTYDEIEKLQEQNNQQHELIHSLQADIDKVCAKIVNMNRTQTQLTRSISELYKIAKAEIGKKNKLITDLRFELEKVKSEKRTCSIKREISPCLHRSDMDSVKKLKRKHEYETNRSRKGRSCSRERYRNPHKDENREKRRKEIGTHNHEKKSARDHNYQKKSPLNDRKKSEKCMKDEDFKRKKSDSNIGRDSKCSFVDENKDVKIVDEGCKQENKLTTELVDGDIPINNNKNKESINQKENKARQNAVLENSQQLCITQVEENKIQKDEKCENSKTNNGNVMIKIETVSKIKKNSEKIEDVTIKLKQKLSSTNEENVSEKLTENTTSDMRHVICYEESDKVCDIKDNMNVTKKKSDVKSDEIMDDNVEKDNGSCTIEETQMKMNGENMKIIGPSKNTQNEKTETLDVEKIISVPRGELKVKQNTEISMKINDKKHVPENTTEESPPSGRVLRSAARRNSSKEITQPSRMFPQKTLSKQLFSNDYDDRMCLTHEGEIPVLHISDYENSPYDRFDLSFSSVATTETKPVDTVTLKDDLNISINQNDSENTMSKSSGSFQEKSLITSSSKKKRRYLVTLIDP